MLFQLNAQQREVLIVLLGENKFTTISDIARQLYLSPRSVRYNLSKIKIWLDGQEITLISRRGLGIFIDATKSQKNKIRQILNNQKENAIYITPKRRLRIILLELLLSQEKVFINDLCERFGVSRTTIHNSLKQLSEEVNRQHLELVQDRNEGLYLKGEEKNVRYTITKTLLDEIKFSTLKEAWIKEDQIESPLYLFENTKSLINRLDFKFGKKVLLNLEKGLGVEYNITSRFFMTLFVGISLERIEKGFLCDPISSQIPNSLESPEISEFINKSLAQKFGKEILLSESRIIELTLYCLEPQKFQEELQHPMFENFFPLALEVISEVAFYLHPSLKVDNQLEKDLANYFSLLFYRLNMGFPVDEPDLREIQSLFPDVFKISIQARNIIKKGFNVPVPYCEVGNLTLIFAAALTRLQGSLQSSLNCLVICEEPLPLRMYLIARLKKEFPTLTLIGADNNPGIYNNQIENVQLVISTSTVDSIEKPIIQINPIPSQNDLEAIRKWLLVEIKEKNQIRLISSDKRSILDILDKEFITVVDQVDDWRNTIPLVGLPLKNAGVINDHYLDAVEDIITTYGPFCHIAPGIILLHAKPSDGVFKLSMGLLLLKEGVNFGNKVFDPVDIIFLLAASDNYSHIFALGQLIALTKNSDFLNDVRTSLNSKEIQSIIWRYTSTELNY